MSEGFIKQPNSKTIKAGYGVEKKLVRKIYVVMPR